MAVWRTISNTHTVQDSKSKLQTNYLVELSSFTVNTKLITRKLCCRKDDRAMRPIWCPENVHDSLTTPTATIPNIVHGLLFRSTL